MKTHRKIGLGTVVLVVLLWSTMSFLAQPTYANDDDDDRGKDTAFTLASLQGAYSAYTIGARGGDGAGSVATMIFDGAGNFSATSIWNVGGQILGPFTSQGTYEVNPDGSFTLTQSEGGAPSEGKGVGVITQSRIIKRRRIVLEAAALGAGLGPGDNVITTLITRQSEKLTPRRDDDDD